MYITFVPEIPPLGLIIGCYRLLKSNKEPLIGENDGIIYLTITWIIYLTITWIIYLTITKAYTSFSLSNGSLSLVKSHELSNYQPKQVDSSLSKN